MIISLHHPFPLDRPSVVNIQVTANVPLSVSVPGSSVSPVRDSSLPVGEFRLRRRSFATGSISGIIWWRNEGFKVYKELFSLANNLDSHNC